MESGRDKVVEVFRATGPVGTRIRPEDDAVAGPSKPTATTRLRGTQPLRLVNGYCQVIGPYDAKPAPKNTYGPPVTDFTFPEKIFSPSKPAHHFKVEMAGFLDDEISFECDKGALYIIGYRSDRDGVAIRTFTETCAMPPGMFAENTKVSRGTNGCLFVEGRYVE